MQFDSHYYHLKNGIRVLEIPMAGVESIAALVLVKTGSRNETPEISGISHVLEHMLFKGSDKYPTPLAVASAVDALGAEYNAYTGKEYTGYYIHADARHFDKSIDILSEMIVRPLIKKEELSREQGVIIEEIHMYEDQPADRAEEEMENLLYGGSTLGRLIIGTKETVSATTPETIRAYKDLWYKGGNILITLVGKVGSIKGMKEVLEDKFGSMGSGPMEDFATKGSYGADHFKHYKKPTEQAHFAMAWPGYDMNNPKRYAAKVLSNILGGSMSSRLFTEVREKRGLAYYVRAGHDPLADVGQFTVKAGVRLEKLSEAMEVVRDQVLGIGKSVTDHELKLAKDNIHGRMVLSLTDPMSVAQYFGHRTLATGDVLPIEKILTELDKVDMDSIRTAAQELLQESEMRAVVVGPKDK
jgi:predicted Zn-dependent peptidase